MEKFDSKIPSRKETYGKKGKLPIFRKAQPKAEVFDFSECLEVIDGKGKKAKKGISKKVLTFGIIGSLLVGGASASLLATWNGDTNLSNIIENVTDYVNKTDSQIEELNGTITQLQGEKEELNGIVTEKQNTIDTLNTQIAEKDDKIAELEEAVTNGELSNDEAQDKITQLTQEKAQMQETIDSLNSQITELNNTIASKDSQIADLQALVNEKQAQIEEKDSQIAELVEEIAKANVAAENADSQVMEILGIENQGEAASGEQPNVGTDENGNPLEAPIEGENGNVGDDNQVEETVIDLEYLEANATNTYNYTTMSSKVTLTEGITKIDAKNDYYVEVSGNAYNIYNNEAELVNSGEFETIAIKKYTTLGVIQLLVNDTVVGHFGGETQVGNL